MLTSSAAISTSGMMRLALCDCPCLQMTKPSSARRDRQVPRHHYRFAGGQFVHASGFARRSAHDHGSRPRPPARSTPSASDLWGVLRAAPTNAT
jgi:hypothetical protein